VVDIVYRGPGAWGGGKGAPLTKPEIDGNFWALASALQDLIDNPPSPNEIAGFEVTGSQFTVVMGDGSRLGPLPLPVIMIKWRGEYQVGALYKELDVLTVANRGVFMVLEDHVGENPFNPDDIDSRGPFYQQLWGELTSAITNAQDGDLLVFDGLTGEWTNKTLAEVMGLDSGGITDLNSLTDVVISGPSDGQALLFDAGSGHFVNRNLPADSDTPDSGDVTDLNSLTDVVISSPADGQSVVYDGTSHKFVNRTVSGGGGGGGDTSDITDLASLDDVELTDLQDGDALVWDEGAGKFVNRVIAGGGDSGGGSITFNPRGEFNDTFAYSPGDVAKRTTSAFTKAFLCYEHVETSGGSDTLSPSANTNFTYTNGDKTATATSAIGNGNWQATRSVASHTAGKWVVGVLCIQAHDGGGTEWSGFGIGLVNGSESLTAGLPGQSDANGFMCDLANANNDFWYNSTHSSNFGGSIAAFPGGLGGRSGANSIPGDLLLLYFDQDNGKVWFRDPTRDAAGSHGVQYWGANVDGTDDPTNPSTGFDIATLAASGAVHASIPMAYQGETGAALPSGTLVTDIASLEPYLVGDFLAWEPGSPLTAPEDDPDHWIG
jgi:hypothetical protein